MAGELWADRKETQNWAFNTTQLMSQWKHGEDHHVYESVIQRGDRGSRRGAGSEDWRRGRRGLGWSAMAILWEGEL